MMMMMMKVLYIAICQERHQLQFQKQWEIMFFVFFKCASSFYDDDADDDYDYDYDDDDGDGQ